MYTKRIILVAALDGVLFSITSTAAESSQAITDNPGWEMIASNPVWALLGGFFFCVGIAVMLAEGFKSASNTKDSSIAGCPICGEQPDVCCEGSEIEFNCCVTMVRQKSDYLTLEERAQWDPDLCRYRGTIEQKVYRAVLAEWGTRKG